jgi:hypothetical protein
VVRVGVDDQEGGVVALSGLLLGALEVLAGVKAGTLAADDSSNEI